MAIEFHANTNKILLPAHKLSCFFHARFLVLYIFLLSDILNIVDQMGIRSKDIAKTFFTAIVTFLQDKSQNSIKKIDIVVLQPYKVKYYTNYLHKPIVEKKSGFSLTRWLFGDGSSTGAGIFLYRKLLLYLSVLSSFQSIFD